MQRMRIGPIAGICAIGFLAFSGTATAAVSTTNVASPTNPHFSIFDGDNAAAGNLVDISGTSDGGAADSVDLRCYIGNGATVVQAAVPVQAGGAFTATGVTLAPIKDQTCILRAVPAGTTPSGGGLAPFTGPEMLTGSRLTTKKTIGAANLGAIQDYTITNQQTGGSVEASSISALGLVLYLYNNGVKTTKTWSSAGAVRSGSTRAGVQIDGENSYAAFEASTFGSAALGYPPLTYSYSQDAANGNLTITESSAIVKCPPGAFPPSGTNCGEISDPDASFHPTGVTYERTIRTEANGRLTSVTDRWISTDGLQHSLDLNPEARGVFGGIISGGGITPAYQFPGEAGFSSRSSGNIVTFDTTAPGTIAGKDAAAADGAVDKGRGAIVFDRSASPATFLGGNSLFSLQQHATIPAGGEACLRYAYAQAYNSADLSGLTQTALDRFATPACGTPDGGPGGGAGSGPPVPSPEPQPQPQPITGSKKCKKKKKGKHKAAFAKKRCKKKKSKKH